MISQSHITSQLLHELQLANDEPVWDDHADLLLWLLCIGGAFAPAKKVRLIYVTLLRSNYATRFGERYSSWPEVLGVLKQFTWSDKAFISEVKALWEEIWI
jgi:hypothetical protein